MATKDAAFISISAMRNLLIFYSIFCLHCKLRCAQDIAQQRDQRDGTFSYLRRYIPSSVGTSIASCTEGFPLSGSSMPM